MLYHQRKYLSANLATTKSDAVDRCMQGSAGTLRELDPARATTLLICALPSNLRTQQMLGGL